MEPEPLSKLTSAPKPSSWRQLCESLSNRELAPEGVSWLQGRLASWALELREAPTVWALSPEKVSASVRALVASLRVSDALPYPALLALLSWFPEARRLSVDGLSFEGVSAACTGLQSLSLSRASLSSLDLSGALDLRWLDLSQNQLTEEVLATLPASLQSVRLDKNALTHWSKRAVPLPLLQSLSLSQNPGGAENALEALWVSDSLPSLRELDLSGFPNAFAPLYYHPEALPIGRSLQSLDISGCDVDDDQLESLALRAERFPLLTSLRFYQNDIGDDTIAALGRSWVGRRVTSLGLSASEKLSGFELGSFTRLKSLSLHGDSSTPLISAEFLRELPWKSLESLDLAGLRLGEELGEVLCELRLASLVSLDLQENELSAASFKELLASSDLSSLRRLSLAKNPIGSAVAFFAEYESAFKLESLDLTATGLDQVGLSKLLEWLEALLDEGLGVRSLSLSGNSLGAEAAELLSQSRGVSLLTSLLLEDCALDDQSLLWLSRSEHLSQLRTLSLYNNPYSEEALRRLLSEKAVEGLSALHIQRPTDTSALANCAGSYYRTLEIITAPVVALGQDAC